MRKVIMRVLVNAIALFIASCLFDGIRVHSPLTFLWAGIFLGLINLIFRLIVLLLTLPINLLTMGLFILVVNALMIWLTAAFIPGLIIQGFITAFLTALVLSICNWLFNRSLKQRLLS